MRSPLTLLVVLSAALSAQQKRPLSFEDFSALRNVSDPQVSPDGKRVLYAVRTTDVAANRRTTRTYVISVADGSLKLFPDGNVSASEARWSPDGARVVFTASGQLWIADANGVNAHPITALSTGASGPVWSPAGDRIAFVSSVYPECTDNACNEAKAKAAADSKVKAHITESLLYRHWTAYDEGTRSHLFVVRTDGTDLRDLTPRARYDVPPGPFGGSEGYALSPDGREAAFTAKDQGRADAWSTDVNVYVVPTDGTGQPQAITAANKGADQNPVYSPDGKWILYASQARAGAESDRWRLMVFDRAAGKTKELTPGFDRWAEGYVVTPDSKRVLIVSQNRGREAFYYAPLDAAASPARPTLAVSDHNNSAPSISRDGGCMVWIRDAVDHPAEVWIGPIDGTTSAFKQLTHENDALLSQIALHPAEDFWFKGPSGDSVHGMVIKPPQFQAGKKFPLLFLIHGGPQGAWLDAFGSRWAPQMFAAQGYGVVMVNPQGSTGYGQKFIDAVSHDWGGGAYQTLMKGLDVAVQRNPWLDSTRMAAAGASYGGYMANWLEGHTTRFKAIVSHAGVFNLEAMAGATEEQWFIDRDFGGMWWDPKVSASQYRKFSPHLFANNFKTPMLVIHGELDYRVPYTEGLSLFTALQRRDVPSRLVVFPDEGHWISKPQNAQLWWKEVHNWLAKWLAVPVS